MIIGNRGRLISLEISMDYPVKWDFSMILRDLIQNFYDSIGWESFGKEFSIEKKNDIGRGSTIVMQTYGHPFAYEWLTYIGGSTKTDPPGKYVGMYGEGFKICALCLIRMGYSVKMESGDWLIKVCKNKGSIGGRKASMLSYRLFNRKDDGYTRLTLSHVNDKDAAQVDTAMMNFFYPENPLFGMKIAQGKNYAIYRRSDIPIPCSDVWNNIPGILFINKMARGRLSIHLGILIECDMRKKDSRKRSTLDYYESRVFLNAKARLFDAYSSYQMLINMKYYWNDLPDRCVDMDTWYYFICQLVRNVSSDKKYRHKFMRKYTNLIYIDRTGSDKLRNKYILEVNEWAISNPAYKAKKFVNPVFRLLGARSVIKDYEEGKDSPVEVMDDRSIKMIDILFEAFETIYPYKTYEKRPDIVMGRGIHVNPMQYCERDYSKNAKGRKYRMRKVYIDSEYMNKDGFYNAFLKLADSLLHIYGTDRSEMINIAYTDLGAALIDGASVLKKYIERWEMMF